MHFALWKLSAFRYFGWVEICDGERTGVMGAMRPQTPHRSPRQAFGGNIWSLAGKRDEIRRGGEIAAMSWKG